MRTALFIATALLSLALATPPAHAIGCVTGAIAGAIAGHAAGHGVIGAIGGCVAGRAWHNHQVSQQSVQNKDDYVKQRQKYDPNYQDPWADNQTANSATSTTSGSPRATNSSTGR